MLFHRFGVRIRLNSVSVREVRPAISSPTGRPALEVPPPSGRQLQLHLILDTALPTERLVGLSSVGARDDRGHSLSALGNVPIVPGTGGDRVTGGPNRSTCTISLDAPHPSATRLVTLEADLRVRPPRETEQAEFAWPAPPEHEVVLGNDILDRFRLERDRSGTMQFHYRAIPPVQVDPQFWFLREWEAPMQFQLYGASGRQYPLGAGSHGGPEEQSGLMVYPGGYAVPNLNEPITRIVVARARPGSAARHCTIRLANVPIPRLPALPAAPPAVGPSPPLPSYVTPDNAARMELRVQEWSATDTQIVRADRRPTPVVRGNATVTLRLQISPRGTAPARWTAIRNLAARDNQGRLVTAGGEVYIPLHAGFGRGY
ncbi:MAG: hypothetical protein FJX77_05910, partial [Armatimonadetes bacterium]|nr:hypothetical protein [Armatimonadota bacterium]